MFLELDKTKVEYIYNEYMTVDFPPDELKPLSHMYKMMDEGVCRAFAFFEGDEMLSYFFLCEQDGFSLVDYLAVNPQKRGQGIGTKTLNKLKEVAADKVILVECEDVDFSPSADEKKTRERRIAFYERAGFKLSDIRSKLFGVRYVILTFPADASDAENGFCKVYKKMLGEEMFNNHFEIC